MTLRDVKERVTLRVDLGRLPEMLLTIVILNAPLFFITWRRSDIVRLILLLVWTFPSGLILLADFSGVMIDKGDRMVSKWAPVQLMLAFLINLLLLYCVWQFGSYYYLHFGPHRPPDN